jgi:hypothetical protein
MRRRLGAELGGAASLGGRRLPQAGQLGRAMEPRRADRPDEVNGGRVAAWAERPNRPAGR